MAKVGTLLKIVRLFSNWPTVLLIHGGFRRPSKWLCTLRNGIKYNVFKEDWPTILEVWSDNIYTPCGCEIRNGYTVVDIGAHVGIFSVFAARCADSVRVVSYEPHPDNFDLLTKNVGLNRLENIVPFQLAVAGTSRRRRLFVNKEDVGHSLVQSTDSYVEVDCVTLEWIIGQVGKCDFLKMDCEGAEYEVLFNTPVEHISEIGQLSIECHNLSPPASGPSNWSPVGLKTYLERIGFEVTLADSGNPFFSYLYARKLYCEQ